VASRKGKVVWPTQAQTTEEDTKNESAVEMEKKRTSNLTNIPKGHLVIVPQDERVYQNKKKQKTVETRNKQKVKRDTIQFGEENITTACSGTISENKTLGYKLVRDLCHDK